MNLLSPVATAAAVVLLFACLGGVWWWRTRRRTAAPSLPREWALAPRPVFTSDERRVHRALKEALPHHVVLAKLPLVRFCQPVNPDEITYWYELLGSIHVGFAICSPTGRVLAAIDLETERGTSRRVAQVKQAVLGACRVRYLRCPVDHLPSVAELQLLVPASGQPVRAPQPLTVPPPGASVATPRPATSRAPPPPARPRRALWEDSSLFQDSFFSPDPRDTGPIGFSSGESLPRPGTRNPRDPSEPPSARWLGTRPGSVPVGEARRASPAPAEPR